MLRANNYPLNPSAFDHISCEPFKLRSPTVSHLAQEMLPKCSGERRHFARSLTLEVGSVGDAFSVAWQCCHQAGCRLGPAARDLPSTRIGKQQPRTDGPQGMTYGARQGHEANESPTGDANPRAQQADTYTWLAWKALVCCLYSMKTTVVWQWGLERNKK